MPSIIEGYNYDIFLSYRQKDNKYDGWVTEFVDNLKKELEATFKEEISVYFDINPHDGLLETHDVDESLKEKLKCLVFIPIISRTYCDPKSFAWEHEFKAFVEQASKDQFGLKVKLPSGNVANRVLPIRIYDLEATDIKLYESVLGGVLRGVEFIYSEPGVNRPLKSDDDEKINLNKTKYRNQINKVSNAIREEITALEQYSPQHEEVSREVNNPFPISRGKDRTKIIAGSAIAIVLIILGFFFIPTLFKSEEQLEKSIAVLPFRNDTPVDSNKYYLNGIMEEVTLNLQAIKELRVPGRTSVEKYRNTTKSIPEIARELGVCYIVEGSGEKNGKRIRLRIQLLDGRKDKHLWGEPYELVLESPENISRLESQIAQSIAAELKAVITPEEKQLIERTPTASLTAHNFYLRGNYEQSKYSDRDSSTRTALDRADRLYKKALENDPSYAQAYVGMALVYWNKYYWETFISENFLDSVLILTNKALSIDGQLSEAHRLKGNYYRQIGDYEQAVKELSKAIEFNPNDGEAYYRRAEVLYFNKSDYAKSLEDFQIAMSLVQESLLPDLYRDLSWEYLLLGFVEKANYYCEEAFTLDRDSLIYYFYLSAFEYGQGNFVKADEFLLKAYAIDSSNISIIFRLGENFMFLGQYEESLKYFKEWLKHTKPLSDNSLFNIYRVGWAYWQNGFKKEAKVYFNKQIEYINIIMEMGHSYQTEHPSYNLAAVFSFMGDRKKAYENLREWARKPFCSLWSLTFLRNDPFFNSIRNEPEFQKIVSDQEAKYNAEHERAKKWLEEHGML